jgi:uncharacterized membrane protein YkvA (DUF1232 family)
LTKKGELMTQPIKTTPAKRATAAKKATPAKKATDAKKAMPAKKATPAKKGPVTTKAAGAVESKFFRRATERARRIAGDPQKLRDIADKAGRSRAIGAGPFGAVADDFRALIRLVVAYARGHYREIPVDSLVMVVACLIYVVSPLDFIPDTIPGIGVVDDLAVVGWVLKMVHDELDAFREWEAGATD